LGEKGEGVKDKGYHLEKGIEHVRLSNREELKN
jgi:hypothetical protein